MVPNPVFRVPDPRLSRSVYQSLGVYGVNVIRGASGNGESARWPKVPIWEVAHASGRLNGALEVSGGPVLRRCKLPISRLNASLGIVR